MRDKPSEFLERCRVKSGQLRSDSTYGNNGAFSFRRNGHTYFAVASDGMGWEHVSVSRISGGCPSWDDMCYAKDLFWDDDETVIQYHPAKENYVNCHKACLHLWKPTGVELPKPMREMVGPVAAASGITAAGEAK